MTAEQQRALIMSYVANDDLRRRNGELVGAMTDEQLLSITPAGKLRASRTLSMIEDVFAWSDGELSDEELRASISSVQCYLSDWTLELQERRKQAARLAKSRKDSQDGT